MDNVFCTKQKIDLRYDLKGSTYGRKTITDPSKKHDHTIALKDVDFIDNKAKFRIGESNRKKILEVIRKDCDFFIQNNIIDYSLLVGISNKADMSQSIVSQRDKPPQAIDNSPCYTLNNSMVSVTAADDKKFYQMCDGGIQSSDKTQVYFMGIIDIFTEYNAKKRVENMYKTVV